MQVKHWTTVAWTTLDNSLFFGISEGLMNRLQSVQDAAARLVLDI